MRRLFSLIVITILTISLSNCSDSGTGLDPDNDSNGSGEQTTTYTVSVNVTPSDAGSISPTAEDTYDEGEEVELQANPSDGYVFTEWTGDIESTDNPHFLTIDQDYNITANFKAKSYELTINKEGEGTVNEEVIKQKSTEYEQGTVVELTANPAKGYKFIEWQGDVTGTDNPTQITVDDSKEVTAVFEKKNFSLSTNTTGEGSVARSPDQTEYEYNSTVELTANSSEGWEFVEWQGDVSSTSNPFDLTIDSNIEVSAVFEKKTFTLSMETSGEGSVSLNPDQIEYEYGTQVELTASTTGDWEFDKWNGDITGGMNPITVMMYANKSITALFENSLFAGGAGTENHPYQVSTPEQLQAARSYPSNHFVQVNNIDLIETKNWNEGKGFFPIGGGGSSFEGTYDGQGFVVNNLTIDRSDENAIGLFGALWRGTVKNISVNGYITGGVSVGGLVGFSPNGTIENSSANVTVNGSENVGGLVGRNAGSIYKSHATGTVTSKSISYVKVGGLVGMNYGHIESSHATGNVTADSGTRVGGLVGGNQPGGTIDNSYATGNVIGRIDVGGLVGLSFYDPIKNSYATGNVQGEEDVGGLIGNNNSSIENSYALGEVNGEKTIGGFAGVSDGIISTSYAAGKVSGSEVVGGFVGINNREVNDSYWNVESTNQDEGVVIGKNSSNLTGLTTSQMTGTSAETNMSAFNFGEIWVTSDEYPILFWE